MGNKEINIAVIVPYPVFPAKTGGQKCIVMFYDFLRKKVPVTLFCTSDTKAPERFKNIVLPVLGSHFARYGNPLLFFRLKKYFKENNITHLIIVHPYFGWLGTMLKYSCKVDLIVQSHNIEALRFKSMGKWWWKILWWYEKFTHRKANHNFFITDDDKYFAIQNFLLDPSSCTTITYGIHWDKRPEDAEREAASLGIRKAHAISEDEKILLFNGTLNYLPNLNAVDVIVKHINPLLKKKWKRSYKIIICGPNLPENYNNLEEFRNENIIYAGFVESIKDYFLGADMFINPVIEGGGIKTKLVEALGSNLTSVSTVSGATGIDPLITGNKLKVVSDNDWHTFAEEVMKSDGNPIPSGFFEYFYWGKIAEKATTILKQHRV